MGIDTLFVKCYITKRRWFIWQPANVLINYTDVRDVVMWGVKIAVVVIMRFLVESVPNAEAMSQNQ